MHRHSIVFFAACFLSTSYGQNVHGVDMFGLINILYTKADQNLDGIISKTELDSIYHGFDSNGDKVVSESEFSEVWMAISQMTQEEATAFFLLADLNDNEEIDSNDLNSIYQRFDLNGDGSVQAQEFNLKWQQLYHEAPIAVLYTKADTNHDDGLQKSEFSLLFSSFGSKSDSSVTKLEFETGWTKSIGFKTDADALFGSLDSNRDGILTTGEVTHVFSTYDVSHNGRVELLELLAVGQVFPTVAP